MKVYIAGPMSGRELYNFPAFAAAAERWRAAGHTVITPPEITNRLWQFRHGRDYDPAADRAEWGDAVTCELFKADLSVVCDVDALALLPGWEQSRGAKMEVAIACALGKRFYTAETFELLDIEATAVVHRVLLSTSPALAAVGGG